MQGGKTTQAKETTHSHQRAARIPHLGTYDSQDKDACDPNEPQHSAITIYPLSTLPIYSAQYYSQLPYRPYAVCTNSTWVDSARCRRPLVPNHC